jgi:nucleoside-diphosphate-sugar epimerase
MPLALVTGANGFIGSHLVEHLLASKMEVRCLVRKSSDLRWIEGLPVRIRHGDVRDGSEDMKSAVDQVDLIFHLAGSTKAQSQESFDSSNFTGTMNLAEAAVRYAPNLSRFVLVSSQAAAGPSKNRLPVRETDVPRPVTPYGRSKLKAEQALLARSGELPVVVVRPPSVYGPRDRDFLTLIKLVNRGLKLRLGFK